LGGELKYTIEVLFASGFVCIVGLGAIYVPIAGGLDGITQLALILPRIRRFKRLYAYADFARYSGKHFKPRIIICLSRLGLYLAVCSKLFLVPQGDTE
jgi:hypothetical protein